MSGGCSSRPPTGVTPPVARHVVFITIDTLRADRLGCYGNSQVATPNIDRLAREGAMAPQAAVHVPLTRPSHISIFTGLYPAEHAIRDNVAPSLSKDVPTLAEVVNRAGFDTAGFVSSIVLSAQSGLGRGFDTFSDRFDVGADDARFLNTLQKRGDVVTAEAIAWIKAHASGRTFTWLHLYDPHDPYEPPEPYATRYAERPYDGEVAWSDELVGRVDRALQHAGIRDDTLVIVTSDHGEGLGEHGENVHGYFVYETTLRVPLIVRGPGVKAGTRLGVTARAVDLFPTVLDLIGIARPTGAKLSGRSLADAMRGRAAPAEEPSFAESLTPLIHYGWSDLRALRDGRWKYVLAPRPELYDLARDPSEAHNLADAEPARARALGAGLERHLEQEKTLQPASGSLASIPPDLLERLGALGYVGAGGPSSGTKPSGADPKDKIDEYKVLNRLMRDGLVRLRENDPAGSAARFRELAGRGVDSFEVHYYYGRALMRLERWREAASHFQTAIERLPAYSPAYLELARARSSAGNLRGALAALGEGRRVDPNDPELYELEAGVWQRLGNRDAAVRAYETALPLAPKDALIRVRLGELYRKAGQIDRAVALIREATTLEPVEASYWNSLGMVLGGAGDLAGAEAAFREAVSHDPSDAQYAYNLGLALQRQARIDEAAGFFRKALELDPRFGPARQRLADMRSR